MFGPHQRKRGDVALTDANPAFGRNRRKWLETSQPMRQKAIQDLLSRFRWSPTISIFDGFLTDLNRALSALFFKIGSQKSEKLGTRGGGSRGRKSEVFECVGIDPNRSESV